jgi:hypothetical protein
MLLLKADSMTRVFDDGGGIPGCSHRMRSASNEQGKSD